MSRRSGSTARTASPRRAPDRPRATSGRSALPCRGSDRRSRTRWRSANRSNPPCQSFSIAAPFSVSDKQAPNQARGRQAQPWWPMALVVAMPGVALIAVVLMLVVFFGFLDAGSYTSMRSIFLPDPVAAAGTVALAGGAEGVTLSIVIIAVFFGI